MIINQIQFSDIKQHLSIVELLHLSSSMLQKVLINLMNEAGVTENEREDWVCGFDMTERTFPCIFTDSVANWLIWSCSGGVKQKIINSIINTTPTSQSSYSCIHARVTRLITNLGKS